MFAVVLLVFVPGATGGYLLDDFHVLEPLSANGGIDSLRTLMSYIFSSSTGPMGRPVSLLTFALNAQAWPADPYPFLVTNIVIHALTAVLVFIFVRRLLASAGVESDRNSHFLMALFAALIWALHPIHSSSVLYIVQRMTLLSALFSILVFICYLDLRKYILLNKAFESACYLFLCALFSILALFSKENAVLIPAQLLLLECFLRLQGAQTNQWSKRLFIYVLAPCSIIIAGYLLFYLLDGLFGSKPGSLVRGFDVYERLLTQARVLGDYLMSILVPRMQGAGVFHDNYPISQGLLQPATTLFWIIVHFGLLVTSWVYRRKLPLIFLGVFWFYLSHAIESTVIMLEIKFEHRNYLATIGVALAVVSGFSSLLTGRRVRVIMLSGVVGLCGLMTSLSASLWGNPALASKVWVEENPGSARALEHAAKVSLEYEKDINSAEGYLQRFIEVSPTSTNKLKYISVFCKTFDGNDPDWTGLAEGIRNGPRDWSLHRVISDLLSNKKSGVCELVGYKDVILLITAYRESPMYEGQLTLRYLDPIELSAALNTGDIQLIRKVELRVSEMSNSLSQAVYRAGMLATHGYLALAQERLSQAIEAAAIQLPSDSRKLVEAQQVLLTIEQDLNRVGND